MANQFEKPSLYDRALWGIIQQSLKSNDPHERYIDPEILAHAIEAFQGSPLPFGLQDYTCRFIRREIKKPRGRRTHPRTSERNALISTYYPIFQELIANRKSDPSLDDWIGLLKANAKDHPPHEQAAMMVVELIRGMKIFPMCDYGHVINVAKKGR